MNQDPPIHENPFTHLAEIYEKARKKSQAMSRQARLKDWTRYKSPETGSASRGKPAIYVSPASGVSVQI